MIKSGFNGFQKKSAITNGMKSVVDSFGAFDKVIRNILNSDNTQVFTTLSPKNFETISVGGVNVVHRWNPMYAPAANLHLTQSTSTNLPSLNDTYKLGKVGGLRCITDDWMYQASTETTSSANKSYFLYWRQIGYGGVGASESIIGHSNYASTLISQAPLQCSINLRTYNSGVTSFAVGLQPSNKSANLLFVAGAALNNTSNLFRVFRASINTQRTASLEIRNENFNYVGAYTTATSTKTATTSSFTYTPDSIPTYSTAFWDTNFPGHQFGASRFFIGMANSTDLSYYALIYIPTDITANQTIQLKYILDKAYGEL